MNNESMLNNETEASIKDRNGRKDALGGVLHQYLSEVKRPD
jgi:hypothetical protein